ncbi:hypothetical protein M8494_37665 [Serratia ureilytica]
MQRDEVWLKSKPTKWCWKCRPVKRAFSMLSGRRGRGTVLSRQLLGRIRPGDSSGKPTAEKSEKKPRLQRLTASLGRKQ